MQAAAEGSGALTSDGQVITGAGALSGVQIIAPTNNTRVILQDNTSAAGKIVYDQTVLVATANGRGDFLTFPTKFYNGLYLTITGVGSSCLVDVASP